MEIPEITTVSQRCPHCGTITYFERKLIWPISSIKSLTPVMRAKLHTDSDGNQVLVNKCLGCSKIIIELDNSVGPFKNRIWPLTKRTAPFEVALVPEQINKDYQEAALIETLSPGASAAISRRCLQNILKDKYAGIILDAFNLKKQVQLTLDANVFPSHITDELHGIRSIGNHSAHTNVDPITNEIVEVGQTEAAACLDVVEQIIDFCYVQPANAKKRKAEREKKFGIDTK